ncbi:LamG domain-containing protein, partial [Lysinibacillus sp. NPDC093692]|uniref:LamG domain-containing protein n=1 Tax=Lysinibacillus sp. NPDC093692 TaxID=3390578 RepID=UPI003D08EB4C
MANSKDNLSKYGKAFIGFDEPSGDVMDSIGGYTGTLVNAPTRVAGWNGNGFAMSFNGTNQRVQFNNTIIPQGKKTIRLKFKPMTQATTSQVLISSTSGNNPYGYRLVWHQSGLVYQVYGGSPTSIPTYLVVPPENITVGLWHDIVITDDGLLKDNSVNIYINGTLVLTGLGDFNEIGMKPTFNLSVGGSPDNSLYFNGQLDYIEFYDIVISPISDKYLVQHNSEYKHHDGTSWQSTTPTEENFIQYGMNNLNHIKEKQWKELSGDKSVVMWSDFEGKQFASVVLNKKDFKAQDLLGDNPQAIYYTDSDTSLIAVETGVDPYSVYDYIGELPTIVAYTESTDDII